MKKLTAVLLVFCLEMVRAQVPINAYAAVTAISGTSLSVGSVDETYHSFEDGDYIIIMQMQDDVIGSNTTNVSTFGDLGSIQSAGLCEVAQVLSHTESSLLPNSITLANPLVNTYHINSNASVQLITFRFLGANFTSTANIGTLAWNGTIGGVAAMSVTGVFTLGHSITANGSGFAAGLKNTPNGYSACDDFTYFTAVATRYARKGEGIYRSTNSAFGAGRGKILNGGGGGNDVNSGGGGGGNYLSGGGGGSGWTPSNSGCSPIVGGLGGVDLSGSISASRFFMGGGGGGGHENDGAGTIGGVGGGIIVINAGTLTTASCAGINISANGVNASNAGNDGAGGGGAGGSIIFSVSSFNVTGGCPLTINANGGNGGNSNAGGAGAHGGGGGGAQGVIIYSGAQPTTNISNNTIPGSGGVSCAGCPSGVNGAAGTGPANAGVIPNLPTVLPIELLSFTAAGDNFGNVVLNWTTAVEKNSREFILERMNATNKVSEIAYLPSTGNNSKYRYLDTSPEMGINYYRLKQLDEDGSESFKQWIAVNIELVKIDDMIIYPNPLRQGNKLSVQLTGIQYPEIVVQVLDTRADVMINQVLNKKHNGYEINTSNLPNGLYIVRIRCGELFFYKKLVITG